LPKQWLFANPDSGSRSRQAANAIRRVHDGAVSKKLFRVPE
jgi:hypothetical protein